MEVEPTLQPDRFMIKAVHRLVEYQAATRGDTHAYAAEGQEMTYRELNHRANALARALITSGFRRAAVAAVRIDLSADLLVVLLAVLKTGGAYMWVDGGDPSWPAAVSMRDHCAAGIERWVGLDVARVLNADAQPSPNLPILTRGSDIACVMRRADGAPDVLVPHATIAALLPPTLNVNGRWSAGEGALDAWVALMAGATVTPTIAPMATVAA